MRTILEPALFVTAVSFGALFLVSCSAGFRGSIDNPMSFAPTVADSVHATAMAAR